MKPLAVLVTIGILLISCQSEPSLQTYFVKNVENRSFISLDVSPSILNMKTSNLTAEQNAALSSFDKMNVLAFKLNDSNRAQFETERDKVTKILKDEKYQQLMKFSSGKEGASLSFVGDDEHIDEFVVFANQKDAGFAVVRILGNDMNPTQIVSMLTLLRESKLDLDQLKPLQQMLEKR